MSAGLLREQIGGTWVGRRYGWWQHQQPQEIRPIARIMREGGARFAAMVTTCGDAGTLRISWHWDLSGTLLSIETEVGEGVPVPSIVDIYPGADWAEREAQDYYAMSFSDRPDTPPLMLRDSDKPGIFLRQGGRL